MFSLVFSVIDPCDFFFAYGNTFNDNFKNKIAEKYFKTDFTVTALIIIKVKCVRICKNGFTF